MVGAQGGELGQKGGQQAPAVNTGPDQGEHVGQEEVSVVHVGQKQGDPDDEDHAGQEEGPAGQRRPAGQQKPQHPQHQQKGGGDAQPGGGGHIHLGAGGKQGIEGGGVEGEVGAVLGGLSKVDAQDVTQDAFVRVWEGAVQYRPQGSPMAWLLTITRNLARMKLRQGARQAELSEEEWEAIPADSPSVTPEDRELLQTALAALEDQERQVVLLHAVTGLKHREIAALLEMPLATVLSKYHRALKKLKNKLKGDGPL